MNVLDKAGRTWYNSSMNEQEQLAYMAGLLDAEGSFYSIASKAPSSRGGVQFVVKINMVDEDIIKWCRDNYRPGGKISQLPKRLPHHKYQYRLFWSGKNAYELALMVAPYMCDRRRGKIEELTGIYTPSLWGSLNYKQKLAWVAGYWEGEGCFYWSKRHKGVFAELRSTDEDAVLRVHNILNGGYIFITTPKQERFKISYVTRTTNRLKTKRITEILYPYMFSRRRAKIDELRDLTNDRECGILAA